MISAQVRYNGIPMPYGGTLLDLSANFKVLIKNKCLSKMDYMNHELLYIQKIKPSLNADRTPSRRRSFPSFIDPNDALTAGSAYSRNVDIKINQNFLALFFTRRKQGY
ncbi:hypothetical protein AC249_AIPGENE13994 [Exaiptasia diaphana]|nr:hypothetical protein AC249_AIPGENE13994 [Exaiptasia diaphana]